MIAATTTRKGTDKRQHDGEEEAAAADGEERAKRRANWNCKSSKGDSSAAASWLRLRQNGGGNKSNNNSKNSNNNSADDTGSFSHKYAQRVLNILYDFCKSSRRRWLCTRSQTSIALARSPAISLCLSLSFSLYLSFYLCLGAAQANFGPNAFVHQLSCPPVRLLNFVPPPLTTLFVLLPCPTVCTHTHAADSARGGHGGRAASLETHATACKLCDGQNLKYGVATKANWNQWERPTCLGSRVLKANTHDSWGGMQREEEEGIHLKSNLKVEFA